MINEGKKRAGPDADYVAPEDERESTDEEDDPHADEDYDGEIGWDEMEVMGKDGRIEVYKKAGVAATEAEEEEQVRASVAEDKRHARIQQRRIMRYTYIAAKYKDSRTRDTELDMSDRTNVRDAKLGSGKKQKHAALVQCENGTIISDGSAAQEWSEEELREKYGDDWGMNDCECKICQARAKNRLEIADTVAQDQSRRLRPRNNLKSFESKHGSGRRLGES